MHPVLDHAYLDSWCDRYLGAQVAGTLFRSGHLSEVVGVELVDGRRVVIKARPADPRIAGCLTVQEHLARAGYPCPAPLAAAVLDRRGSVACAVTAVDCLGPSGLRSVA
jgi:hypothetical protein